MENQIREYQMIIELEQERSKGFQKELETL